MHPHHPSKSRPSRTCFHTDHKCAQRGDPDPDKGDRLKIIESAVLTLTSGQQGKQKSDPPAAKPSGEFCRKWNLRGCSYPRCRHSHSCSNCRGNDPAVKCPTRTVGVMEKFPFRFDTVPFCLRTVFNFIRFLTVYRFVPV